MLYFQLSHQAEKLVNKCIQKEMNEETRLKEKSHDQIIQVIPLKPTDEAKVMVVKPNEDNVTIEQLLDKPVKKRKATDKKVTKKIKKTIMFRILLEKHWREEEAVLVALLMQVDVVIMGSWICISWILEITIIT